MTENSLRHPGPQPANPAEGPDRNVASSRALLGIWRLGSLIHEGAHSRVWAAQPADSSGSPRWDYAVRTAAAGDSRSRGESAAQLQRFSEAAAAARHPHLIAVLDASPEGSEPFLVMPRLAARSLAEVLAEGRTRPLPIVLWLVRQAAQAAAALHEAGFMHGDIKPDNVLVSPQGHATLIDLGFARRVGSPGDDAFRGSYGYAAPETMRSAPAPAAAASDVFSLGRLLWQLLSLTDDDLTLPACLDPVADLIAEMVADDPSSRPPARNVANRLVRLEIETLGRHIRPASDPTPHERAA